MHVVLEGYILFTSGKLWVLSGKHTLFITFIVIMNILKLYSSSVGKLDQAGRPASACTGLYWQKGNINPGDTGSQPRQLHISRDI
jgi:hypothetical protein